jgi:hypothetical protein
MTQNGIDCPTHDDSCVTVTATTTGTAQVDVQIQYNSVSLTGFTAVILPAKVKARAVMRWQ